MTKIGLRIDAPDDVTALIAVDGQIDGVQRELMVLQLNGLLRLHFGEQRRRGLGAGDESRTLLQQLLPSRVVGAQVEDHLEKVQYNARS